MVQILRHELYTTYRPYQYYGHVHPQRETCDYGVISDAEYLQDIQHLLDEQRHEVALECVEKGIYKDVFEAK